MPTSRALGRIKARCVITCMMPGRPWSKHPPFSAHRTQTPAAGLRRALGPDRSAAPSRILRWDLVRSARVPCQPCTTSLLSGRGGPGIRRHEVQDLSSGAPTGKSRIDGDLDDQGADRGRHSRWQRRCEERGRPDGRACRPHRLNRVGERLGGADLGKALCASGPSADPATPPPARGSASLPTTAPRSSCSGRSRSLSAHEWMGEPHTG